MNSTNYALTPEFFKYFKFTVLAYDSQNTYVNLIGDDALRNCNQFKGDMKDLN